MLDFVSWYFSSLAEFWGSAVRIGLPHILLVILLVCWLRRRKCGKVRDDSCRWIWSWGCGPRTRCCAPGCCENCECCGAWDEGCAPSEGAGASTAGSGAAGGEDGQA